jgi:hypothetical protein
MLMYVCVQKLALCCGCVYVWSRLCIDQRCVLIQTHRINSLVKPLPYQAHHRLARHITSFNTCNHCVQSNLTSWLNCPNKNVDLILIWYLIKYQIRIWYLANIRWISDHDLIFDQISDQYQISVVFIFCGCSCLGFKKCLFSDKDLLHPWLPRSLMSRTPLPRRLWRPSRRSLHQTWPGHYHQQTYAEHMLQVVFVLLCLINTKLCLNMTGRM